MDVDLIALLAAAVVLVAVTAFTASPVALPIPDFQGYLDRWRVQHGDYDPRGNVWLRGWLRVAFFFARPLARKGVLPDVLTIWTVWLAASVFVVAGAGGRWPILAGWLLVASGLGDTLDGCVAVLTDRATKWGYVLDSAVDRVNDVLYLFAVVAVGAPLELGIAAGSALFLMEYVRVRASNAGAGDVVVVTIGERATRVILCAAGIHFGGVFVARSELVATIGLGATAAVATIALGQMVWAARRQLVGVSS